MIKHLFEEAETSNKNYHACEIDSGRRRYKRPKRIRKTHQKVQETIDRKLDIITSTQRKKEIEFQDKQPLVFHNYIKLVNPSSNYI